MSATYDRLAELPITIECYELSGHDREFGRLHPPVDRRPPPRRWRRRGSARTSSTTCSTTSPTATPGRCSTSPGPRRSGRRASCSASSTCSRARPRSASPHATTGAGRTSRRRSTSPCARTGSRSGRRSSATRSRCASSARRGCRASTATRSRRPSRSATGSPRYPDLEFKLDPENDWNAELIDEIARARPGPRPRPQGHVPGTPVDVDTDPELYRAVAETFEDAYLEDPDINDETRRGAGALRRPDHLGCAARVPRRRQGARPQGDQLQAVAVRLAARSCSRSTSTATRTGSRSTAAGRAS